MKYVCASLIAAVLLLGWLYRCANVELADTKTALVVAEEANKTNLEAISRLERSIQNTNEVLAGWDKDRTTLAGVRSATKQAIKEVMRDETFKRWANDVTPDDAWRLLRQANSADKDDASDAANSTAVRLPGNSNPKSGD